MRRRLLLAGSALVIGAITVMVACGAEDRPTASGVPADSGSSSDGSSVPGDGGVGITEGVVLLHAASFPSLRVCFENYKTSKAMPDRTLMPQSNVVGLAMGTAVRIDPMPTPPGKVYIINEARRRVGPNSDLDEDCETLLDSAQAVPNVDWFAAGEIKTPIGVGSVALLAITGCANEVFLETLGIDGDLCGDDWRTLSGNLRARTFPVVPGSAPTVTDLGVQLLHLAEPLEAVRGAHPLSISFGAFDAGPGDLAQKVGDTALFDASAPERLEVDRRSDSVFASHGFRIRYGASGDAGLDAGFSIDQSLAEVQRVSSPSTLPTSYFQANSSYALLLVGDPRTPRTIDGGPNPFFPLRSVHLVAIPVRQPADGGAPSSTTDGGLVPSDAAGAGD